MIPSQTDSNLNLEVLAVYGSLLPGDGGLLRQLLHDLPCGIRWLGPCQIPGTLYALDGYPGLKSDEPGAVSGMLCQIEGDTAAALAALDAYENFDPANLAGSEYLRIKIPLLAPAIRAWVYHYRAAIAAERKIPSGDWLHHSSQNGISI